MAVKAVGCVLMNYIYLVHNKVYCRALVETAMNTRVPLQTGRLERLNDCKVLMIGFAPRSFALVMLVFVT